MASIRTIREKFASLRAWAGRTFLRPDSVTLFHRPGGVAEPRETQAADPAV